MKKLKTVCLLFIFATTFVSVCNAQKKEWKAVEKNPSIVSCEKFLSDFPNSKFTTDAKELLHELYWKTAIKKNQPEDYKTYLDKFPNGKYADIAKTKFEDLLWSFAEQNPSSSSYQKYIDAFPQGKHADIAKTKIPQLMEAEKEANTKKLFELAMNMYEPALGMGGGKTEPLYNPSKNQSAQIIEFENLLKAGADPNLYRISGFIAPHIEQPPQGYAYTDFGNKGKIVNGNGMTLTEYLETTKQNKALTILKANIVDLKK